MKTFSEEEAEGRLLESGFSEEQAVDVVLITCIFNFMDRLADGLGVYGEPGQG